MEQKVFKWRGTYEGDHHAFALGIPESEQRAENYHDGDGRGQRPFPVTDAVSEDGEEEGAEAET